MRGFFQAWPIYVTNKTADGYIASYEIPSGFALLILFLALLNATIWGFIGLYEAVRVIV